MGKTRPPERSKLDRRKKKLLADKKRKESPVIAPEQLLEEAAQLLERSQPDAALELATNALVQLKSRLTEDNLSTCLPALNLLGEINVELGDVEAAREYFEQAAQIDEDGLIPEDQGGGAEKFLWLAQLSEEGGADSVQWFEKGAEVLRNDVVSVLEAGGAKKLLEEKKAKLATALCAIAEVYMTDLSWDDAQAEEVCNRVMEEAIRIAPDSPETLQTLASVRISQAKKEEARSHLTKSMSLWNHLSPEDPRIPDFPTRISLARLLMEADMEDEAIEVIERLVQEDDTSVEAWYLGGWCLHLLAEKQRDAINGKAKGEAPEVLDLLKRSRKWLLQCLQTYQLLDYEDERLREHASEIIAPLNKLLGEPDGVESEDEEEWEDDAEDGAEESEEDACMMDDG